MINDIKDLFFDITKDPVIKSIIELEERGLIFDREILNEVLFKLFQEGKSQATKEILEEEIRFCQELWDKAEEYTCDGWVLILAGNRMKELKQQLKENN